MAKLPQLIIGLLTSANKLFNFTDPIASIDHFDLVIFSVGYYRPLDNGNGPAAENPGFRGSSVWTEKTVPMTPEEDLHREHVLYART